VTLRMPLDRKNVDGCARAAMRSSEVDDIRKDDRDEVVLGIFRELFCDVLRFSMIEF
jgi:hypothetical protein